MTLELPDRPTMQVNEEAVQDHDRDRFAAIVEIATSVGGLNFYSDMVKRRVPMHVIRDVLRAAEAAKITTLDQCTERNAEGNLYRDKTMIEQRRVIYTTLYNLKHGGRKKYSLPEIANAFGKTHSTVWFSIFKDKHKQRIKLAKKVQA